MNPQIALIPPDYKFELKKMAAFIGEGEKERATV